MSELGALAKIYQRPKPDRVARAEPGEALGERGFEASADPLACQCQTAWWGSPSWNVWITGHHYKCPQWGLTKDEGPYEACAICDSPDPDHHGWDCPWWDEHRSATPF